MTQTTVRYPILAALLLSAPFVQAQVAQPPEPARSTAEVRIDLPAGDDSRVSVIPGSRHIRLELPRGSVFPLDLSDSSGGLLRGGEVLPLDDGRVELRLELAFGLLDRIDYDPESVVLRFISRIDVAREFGAAQDSYRLGPEDKLRITVHNHPELTSQPTVTAEGTITAPLVGDVDAAGLSPRQLAVELSDLLGRSYLVDPQVDVEVEEYRSRWVMVSGDVRLPGRVFLRGGTRLKEVLSEAGGFGEEAGELITISRKREDSDDYATIRIERSDFEIGASNPRMQPGDIIEVSRAAYCYLQGEVRSPSRVRVERGMTLLKAISMVGGLTDWADRREVRVLYEEGTVPRERVFNLKKIQAGHQDDPELRGGEVIIVKRRFF